MQEELRQHHISIETILQRLAKKFADKEGQKGITFFSTNGERLGPCIHFYPDLSKQIQTVCDDAVYEDTMSNILEAMKYTMLPIILQTTVKGKTADLTNLMEIFILCSEVIPRRSFFLGSRVAFGFTAGTR